MLVVATIQINMDRDFWSYLIQEVTRDLVGFEP